MNNKLQFMNGMKIMSSMKIWVLGFALVSNAFCVQAQDVAKGKEVPESKSIFVEKDEPVYPADKGITRQIYGYDDNIMMVKVIFEKGAIGTPHTHIHSQTSYVVSGKFEVTVGDEVKVLKAGDGFYAAPNVKHGCVCLEEGVLIDVFSPMRKDFLPK